MQGSRVDGGGGRPGREGAGSETLLPRRSSNGLGQAGFADPSPEEGGRDEVASEARLFLKGVQ